MREYRLIGVKSNMPYEKAENNFKQLAEYLSLPVDKFVADLHVIKIEYGSDTYKNINTIAANYGFEAYECSYKMKYTKNELLEAKFFEATLDIYGKTDYAESYQTKFKDFYCESCGVHQLIPGEAICINKTEFRGKDIAVSKKINNEIIVSDRMKKLIESAGLTGVKFVPVHHYNNRLKNDYPAWHMIVTSIMPPIDKSMPLYIMDNYCGVCKRHHVLPLSYVRYKESELAKACDFNLSCEMFGNGWYGSPKLIVSRSFYDLIRKNKIKGCRFEIVGTV